MIQITVTVPKDLQKRLSEIGKLVVEPTLVGIATSVQHEITSNKPPPPKRGSMRFVSERQRRFVMAGISKGTIDSPYRRGQSKQSERMNRSYKIIRAPSTITLTNTASYMRYVIGDRQARIHVGRWMTGAMATERVIKSGVIARIVAAAIRKSFK